MKIAPPSGDMIVKAGLVLGAIGLAYIVLSKAGKLAGEAATVAGGIVSGDNAVTQAARTDAYQGAGVLGTVGAATDIASGGVLSRLGEWLGGKAYDLTHPESTAPAINTPAGHTAYWKS